LSAPNAANQLTKKPRIPQKRPAGLASFKKESKKREAEKWFFRASKNQRTKN
jgi:hypothetical protein